ncbi:MAG: glutamate racemase [Pseudomonadota bacterium]|nr:glutamate racemase [Pseudomonadota bacterium]
MRNLPIGVFDSGVGGLTVLAALQQQLPNESFIYLGDMARLPYGTKSPETIARYSLQICDYLTDRGIKMLVVACNTASALALPLLQAERPDLPIIGVLHPGARVACATTRTGHIAVIATEATVNSASYTHAIHLIQPNINVVSASCSLFVALAEEGWTNGEISAAIAREYLNPLLQDPIDTLVLGCTHFPVLSDTIKANIAPHIHLVNSAEATATEVSQALDQYQLTALHTSPTLEFLVTDSPNRFIKTSQFFLPYLLEHHQVSLIDFQHKK